MLSLTSSLHTYLEMSPKLAPVRAPPSMISFSREGEMMIEFVTTSSLDVVVTSSIFKSGFSEIAEKISSNDGTSTSCLVLLLNSLVVIISLMCACWFKPDKA